MAEPPADPPPESIPDRLDELDRRILLELQEDGRRSYREIGETLGISPGRARARALQLMEDGLVEIVAHPNPWRMGFQFFAMAAFRVDGPRVDEVAELLAAEQQVTWVALGATGYDILAEVVMESSEAFGRYKNESLATMPGVNEIEVFVLWDIRKLRYRLGAPDATAE